MVARRLWFVALLPACGASVVTGSPVDPRDVPADTPLAADAPTPRAEASVPPQDVAAPPDAPAPPRDAPSTTPPDAAAGFDAPLPDAPLPDAPPPDVPRADGSTACPGALQRCNGRCVDVQINPLHCGACARPCPRGSTCSGGACATL